MLPSELILSVPWCAIASRDGIGAPCDGCKTPDKCRADSIAAADSEPALDVPTEEPEDKPANNGFSWGDDSPF